MNKKIVIVALALIAFATFASTAKAHYIRVSLEVKDSSDNSIADKTVPLNTVDYIYAHYEELFYRSASAQLEVYYDDGTEWKYDATLFSGTVNHGDTIVKTYTMTELGSYEFIFTCSDSNSHGAEILCFHKAKASTRLTVFVIPEPGTLAGLSITLAAFGFMAFRRRLFKRGD